MKFEIQMIAKVYFVDTLAVSQALAPLDVISSQLATKIDF